MSPYSSTFDEEGCVKPKASRPTGVTIVIIYEAFVGAYSLYATVVGIWLSLYFGQQGYLSYSNYEVGYSGVNLFFAVTTLGVVWGNLKRKEWSWVGALLLRGLHIFLTVWGLLNGYGTARSGGGYIVLTIVSLVVIVISLAIIYYLTRPHVQAYFGRVIPSLGLVSSDKSENLSHSVSDNKPTRP